MRRKPRLLKVFDLFDEGDDPFEIGDQLHSCDHFFLRSFFVDGSFEAVEVLLGRSAEL